MALGFRKTPGTDINLDRGQQQPGHRERRIPHLTHRDETILVHTVMDMDACAPFFAYGRFPTIVVAPGRLGVVAEKQAGFLGQA